MIALYARVSTRDHGQDVEVQLLRLRQWAAAMYPEDSVQEYADQASATDERGRKAWRELLDRCRGGKPPRVVAVVRLDRAFRSVVHGITTVAELGQLDVGFKTLDGDVDTTTPQGRLYLHMLLAWAQFERELTQQRVREGQAKAAAEGRLPGRHRKDCQCPLHAKRGRGRPRKKRGREIDALLDRENRAESGERKTGVFRDGGKGHVGTKGHAQEIPTVLLVGLSQRMH